ncbi:MAG: ACP S-malonyltransferase [Treponema sp.]|jgi:[acyl-carrier-protein] S-malonyltransferase|nr:ACP S-malonyltransferase [Treponema sp.]
MSIKGTKTIFLFPGQGAQYRGMALDLLEAGGTEVKRLFETASEICGKDMQALLRDSDDETLKRTDISQPAITLANLAAAAFLAEQGIHPAACAGFSLGEYAALVCASVIKVEDCFTLVKARGEAMQKSADRIRREADSAVPSPEECLPGMAKLPGMAAVIGLAPEKVESLITEWKTSAGNGGAIAGLYPANINSPKQLVVSGTAAALAEAEKLFKEAGARRFIRLQVAGPFHSPLIADAAEIFRPVLEAASFYDPAIPFYSNVTGTRVTSGAELKKFALAQITSPVRWTEEEAAINAEWNGASETAEKIVVLEPQPSEPASEGSSVLEPQPSSLASEGSSVLETGPGKVLQGLWKDSGSVIPCYAAGTAETIMELL